MSRPTPAHVVKRIIDDVLRDVELDLVPVHELLRRSADASNGEELLSCAETLAKDAFRRIWMTQIDERCRLGLDRAREDALLQAQGCLDAKADLATHAAGSWIAGAILDELSFEVAWDIFGENPAVGVQSFLLRR